MLCDLSRLNSYISLFLLLCYTGPERELDQSKSQNINTTLKTCKIIFRWLPNDYSLKSPIPLLIKTILNFVHACCLMSVLRTFSISIRVILKESTDCKMFCLQGIVKVSDPTLMPFYLSRA